MASYLYMWFGVMVYMTSVTVKGVTEEYVVVTVGDYEVVRITTSCLVALYVNDSVDMVASIVWMYVSHNAVVGGLERKRARAMRKWLRKTLCEMMETWKHELDSVN